jgi:hypothetical protein
MNSSIVCRKWQKLGRAVCACWLAGSALVVPIKMVGVPPGHAVDAIMRTATTTTSGSAIPGPGGVIYNQAGRDRTAAAAMMGDHPSLQQPLPMAQPTPP